MYRFTVTDTESSITWERSPVQPVKTMVGRGGERVQLLDDNGQDLLVVLWPGTSVYRRLHPVFS